MPFTNEETQDYQAFVSEQTQALGCLEFNPHDVVWHYTTGEALLKIVQSSMLYSTQVSCLNDSSEIRYAAELLREAFSDLQTKSCCSPVEAPFLDRLIKAGAEESASSRHLPSWWFVSCFSKEKDDLSQWRAYSSPGDGYAIAFRAGGLFSTSHTLVTVDYDRDLHKKIAARCADATTRFIREGLEKRKDDSTEAQQEWVSEFLMDWDNRIGVFGPIVKDPSFRSENECRIIHQLKINELPKLQFRQKRTLMSRHLPLVYQSLPIVEIMLGPSHRHREISGMSIKTFMQQNGFPEVPISYSAIPFQPTV